MRLLVLVCVTTTASATPWRVDPGPALLAPGRGQRIVTLDDGRVVADVGSLPMVFDGVGWTWIGEKTVMGVGPTVPIPGGLFVASGAVFNESPGALVWDAKTDHWHRSGGLLVARNYEHTEMAAALADGSVLVVGGTQDKNPRVIASAERWTAKADAFVAAGALRSPRWDGTLTALRDGRALVAGGADDYGRGHATAQCDVYDPKTNAWTALPDLHVARRDHTATLLPDGRVLVAGGQDQHEKAVAEIEIFDPKTKAWTIAATLGEARMAHAAVLLPNARVMFVGGTRDDYSRSQNGTTVLSAETYDVAADRFDVFYPPHAYVKPVIALLGDGRLLVAGGLDFTTALDRVELWTPNAGRDAPWKIVAPPAAPVALPKEMGEGSTSTLLADGGVLAIGGHVWSAVGAQRLDPVTHTWAAVAMASARVFHVAVPLPDGHVLIAGGVGVHPRIHRMREAVPLAPAVRSAELFDPKTGTFKRTGAPAVRRERAAATLLADGRVLLCGGGVATCEGWGPKTQQFTRSPPMHVSRQRFTLTTLSSGRVVAIGGDDKGTYEVYEPAKREWSAPRPLPEVWQGHEAEPLPGDHVLVKLRDRAVELTID